MPTNFWTIENDPPPNPGVGNALNGLKIQPVYSGTPPVITGYQLMNGTNLLQANGGTVMPIQFLGVQFASRTWNLTNIFVTPGVNGSGSWSIDPGATRPSDVATGDNGEFTAQAGTGIDPDEAASSAYA